MKEYLVVIRSFAKASEINTEVCQNKMKNYIQVRSLIFIRTISSGYSFHTGFGSMKNVTLQQHLFSRSTAWK